MGFGLMNNGSLDPSTRDTNPKQRSVLGEIHQNYHRFVSSSIPTKKMGNVNPGLKKTYSDY